MKTLLPTQHQVIRRTLLLLLLLLVNFTEAAATHLKAADITAKRDTTPNPNPRRFFFRMVIYTDRASIAEDLRVDINFGDGLVKSIPRGPVRAISPDTDQEVFHWEHTFPADGTYTISWTGVNRHGRILNVAAPSDQHSFYVATTININTFRGFNSTPVLKYPPVTVGNVGRKYVHNPAAFDADGDSLSFKLITPLRQDANSSKIIPIPGYTLPSNLFSCRNATDTGPATFTMDPVTGQLVWDAPCRQGLYTVAYAVEEWRRTAAGAVKISEVVQDMLITIKETPNRPPVLAPKDTCIVAGTTLTGIIRATDPDGDRMSLMATSGIRSAYSFSQTSDTPGLATGYFSWTPSCSDVRTQPYQVVFRAEDIRSTVAERLTDLQPWNIRVVAPPPQNLTVSKSGGKVQLTWDTYACPNASSIRIYRRTGSSQFTPESCQTGVPTNTGYQLIGEVASDATTFLDTNGGSFIFPVDGYCYLISGAFAAAPNSTGQSVASSEACTSPFTLPSDNGDLGRLVQVYPNPARGTLNLQLPGNTSWDNIRLYTITGKLILKIDGNGYDTIKLKLPQSPAGLHLLRIQTQAEVVTKWVLLE